jgi:hypothetical protein
MPYFLRRLIAPPFAKRDVPRLAFDGAVRLGAEVGPEEGRDGAEDLDGAVLDGAVRDGADKLLDGPEREGVLEEREFPPDGVVRDGAFKPLEVGRAEPEGEVRAGAFKLLEVGRLAIVALFAADCSRRLMPAR